MSSEVNLSRRNVLSLLPAGLALSLPSGIVAEDYSPTFADELLAASIWVTGLLSLPYVQDAMQEPINKFAELHKEIDGLVEQSSTKSKDDLLVYIRSFGEKLGKGQEAKGLATYNIMIVQHSVTEASKSLITKANESIHEGMVTRIGYEAAIAHAIANLTTIVKIQDNGYATELKREAAKVLEILKGLSANQTEQASISEQEYIAIPSWSDVVTAVDLHLNKPGYGVILLVYISVKAACGLLSTPIEIKKRIVDDLGSWPLRVQATRAAKIAARLVY